MKSMDEVYSTKGYRRLGWLNFLGFYQRALESVIRSCITISSNDRILDAGCGYGLASKAIENAIKDCGTKIDLYGFDLSTSMPEAYRAYINYPAHLSCMDAKNLDYEDNFFDTILCAGMFEHIDDPEVVISEYIRCLKPGGSLFISVSNQNLLVQSLISVFGNAKGASHKDFSKYFQRSEVIELERLYFKGIHFWANLFTFVVKCKKKAN